MHTTKGSDGDYRELEDYIPLPLKEVRQYQLQTVMPM